MQHVLTESKGVKSISLTAYVGYSWPTAKRKAKQAVFANFNGNAKISTYNVCLGHCIFLAHFQDELVGVFSLYRS